MNFATRAKLARGLELGLVFIVGCVLGSNYFLLPSPFFRFRDLFSFVSKKGLITESPKVALSTFNSIASTDPQGRTNSRIGDRVTPVFYRVTP